MLRIATVQPLEDYSVSLTLTDGSTRVVDLLPRLKGAMYQPLRDDPALFRAIRVEHGTIVWPTGQDIDPDVLLSHAMTSRVANRLLRAMPSICEFDGMSIYVYGNDHNPPHIHVMHADDETHPHRQQRHV